MASEQQLLEFHLQEKKESDKIWISPTSKSFRNRNWVETKSDRNAKPTTSRVKENKTKPSSTFFLSKPQKFQLKTSEVAFYKYPEWLVEMNSVKTQGTALSYGTLGF